MPNQTHVSAADVEKSLAGTTTNLSLSLSSPEQSIKLEPLDEADLEELRNPTISTCKLHRPNLNTPIAKRSLVGNDLLVKDATSLPARNTIPIIMIPKVSIKNLCGVQRIFYEETKFPTYTITEYTIIFEDENRPDKWFVI